MNVNLLYLQRFYSKNSDPLAGTQLFERLREEAAKYRLGYMVSENSDGVEPAFRSDVVTLDELRTFRPDLIFVEGAFRLWGRDRIPVAVLRDEVARGAVVVICDHHSDVISEDIDGYGELLRLCGVVIGLEDPAHPIEIRTQQYGVEVEMEVSADSYATWLSPVFDDLPTPVVGRPALLVEYEHNVAASRRYSWQPSTYMYELGGARHMVDRRSPESGVFAAAKRIGLGFLVFVAAGVSSDYYAEQYPGNMEWLTRLAGHLLDQARIDARRSDPALVLSVPDHHGHREFAGDLRDKLAILGFQLSIARVSHVVLIWSAECDPKKWADEASEVVTSGKRLLIVRMDSTSVPAGHADRLRIEAQTLKAAETATLIAGSIDREIRRPESDRPWRKEH